MVVADGVDLVDKLAGPSEVIGGGGQRQHRTWWHQVRLAALAPEILEFEEDLRTKLGERAVRR